MCSFDTYQFDDYSKVVSSRFDPEESKGARSISKIVKKPLG
jgi:hypothetical protein